MALKCTKFCTLEIFADNYVKASLGTLNNYNIMYVP